METIILIIAILILIGGILFFVKSQQANLNITDYHQLKKERDELSYKLAETSAKAYQLEQNQHQVSQLLKEEKLKLENDINLLRNELILEKGRVARADEAIKTQREKLHELELYKADLQQKFTSEFENIANKILDEKTAKFTEQNTTNMALILNPLKENIKAFEEKVEKTYKDGSDERNTLKGVISQLMLQSKQIQEDANNLTKALKGDSKKQGNWGEVILERVLERSGLVKGQEYRIQTSLQTSDGSRMQPDVIIDLPDNKHIIVDAKVSLVAYEKLINADTDDDRELFVKQHVQSIKNHVNELSSKNYHDLYQLNSPDFVLLFLPIESSFSIAVQRETDLFSYAWDKKVVIVSPSTLLATLRTIASIWKQEQQTRNAIDIATKAGALYDKFVGFINDLKKMGDHIDRARDAYGDAYAKLSSGNGNLVGRVEALKKLGAKAGKQIDNKFFEQ